MKIRIDISKQNRAAYSKEHELVAAVAEWSRYWSLAGRFTSSSPVPLKTHRFPTRRCRESIHVKSVESSNVPRWGGVVVWRGGASSCVVHVP
ncbi:hypothetical protein TNCV_3356951 [Trichonephila clavipes]|nr:hypothetical protein TNCV_3356951 [Trichonephila clavipes]